MISDQVIIINALGTRFYVEIFETLSAQKLELITHDVSLLLSTFEDRYSRFRPDSLISTVNQQKSFADPDAEFIAILTYGQNLTYRTQGMFNMLLGETLTDRGYDSTYSFIANENAKTAPLIPNPLLDLEITSTAIVLKNGSLDLGGFGKGFVIDLLATYLQQHHQLQYFLINGGGDFYGTSNHNEPITIYLEHPTEGATYLGTTTILNQGFAASSPYKRTWVSSGNVYSHIINPQVEESELPFDATFIIADTAATADAFATVALFSSETDFAHLATTEQLAFSRFRLIDNQMTRNEAFNLTPLT